MSRQVLQSLLSLLLLLAGPSGCQAVVQFARVNGTITFTPAPAGSANVLLRNATAVSRFAWYTRDMFEDGIESRANRNVNPLFTRQPRILSLSVTGARNPTSSSLAVSFTSTLRITSATRLTASNYASDIKFAPYFSVPFLTRDYVDDLSDFVLPRIFNDGMGYSANIGTGRIISDPRRTTRRLPDDMEAAESDGDGGDLVFEVLEDLEAENEYTPKKNVRGGV
jgi:hypothetical protein